MSRKRKTSKPKRGVGGIRSNLDVNLSPAERAQEAKDERNLFTFQESIRNAPEYSFNGDLGFGGGLKFDRETGQKRITISDFQKGDKSEYTRDSRRNIIPIDIYPSNEYEKGFDYLLTEGDARAVKLGYACANCLGWQVVPNTPKCALDGGGTCGFRPPVGGVRVHEI